MKKVAVATVIGALVAVGIVSGPAGTAPNSASKLATAKITCGKTRTVGLSAPITGPAASIGVLQLDWARYFIKRYNGSHKNKLKMIEGDSQLPNTAEAIRVAENLASNSSVLGVAGPAGSQEVVASTSPFRDGGLVNISGSATRTSLTDGSRKGYFFRTVPNDDQQGPRVANYIRKNLKKTRVVIIDDEETYSQGLADTVERILKNANLDVRRDSVSQSESNFASLIGRIPSNTQVVYIPWQLSAKAQLFGQQLRAAGKNAILFGSDGLYDPSTFKVVGSYVSFFPINFKSKAFTGFKKSHGGKDEGFGAPTYVALDALSRAIDKACKNGSATRAEVRSLVAKTNIPKKQSLLGFRVAFFNNNPSGPQGPGDLRNPANFGIYKIGRGGKYARVS